MINSDYFFLFPFFLFLLTHLICVVGYVEDTKTRIIKSYSEFILKSWFPQTVQQLLYEMEFYRSINKINMVDNITNVLFLISQQIQQTTQQYDGNKSLVSPESQNFHEILKFLKSISEKYKLTLNENVPAHEVWSYIPSRSFFNGPNSINRRISNKYNIRQTKIQTFSPKDR